MASPGGKRWKPSPLIVASLVLHGAALLVLVLQWGAWPWVLGALIGNHLIINFMVLWPRSQGIGSNRTRLPTNTHDQIAITIDDGPDPMVTPHVLDLLDQHAAKATFFCIGERARQHTELCKEIVRRGHAVENHTQRHSPAFAFSGFDSHRRELQAAQATLSEITGRAPRFFRAPAGIRSPLLDPILHELQLQLVSWTRRGYDTRIGDPAKVSRRLLPYVKAGAILLLHDGNSARTPAGAPVILEVLPVILKTAAQRGLRCVTLAECLPSAHDARP